MNKISWKKYESDNLTIIVESENNTKEYDLNMKIIESKKYDSMEEYMKVVEKQLNKWYNFREVNQEVIENFLYFNGYCEYLEKS